jgi:hypothetical protein
MLAKNSRKLNLLLILALAAAIIVKLIFISIEKKETLSDNLHVMVQGLMILLEGFILSSLFVTGIDKHGYKFLILTLTVYSVCIIVFLFNNQINIFPDLLNRLTAPIFLAVNLFLIGVCFNLLYQKKMNRPVLKISDIAKF